MPWLASALLMIQPKKPPSLFWSSPFDFARLGPWPFFFASRSRFGSARAQSSSEYWKPLHRSQCAVLVLLGSGDSAPPTAGGTSISKGELRPFSQSARDGFGP